MVLTVAEVYATVIAERVPTARLETQSLAIKESVKVTTHTCLARTLYLLLWNTSMPLGIHTIPRICDAKIR